MTDEELQEMIDEADRDGDGEISEGKIYPHNKYIHNIFNGISIVCFR